MSGCKADCFLDTESGAKSVIRPIHSPTKLVWLYYPQLPPGTLEERQFAPCQCGCGNLVANPSVK